MVMHAFLISLYNSLGVFIPLIVVNCIILGRAEAFASTNSPKDAAIDGMGMALGFTGAIAIIAIFREFLGAGTITVWGNLVINLTGMFNFIGITPIGMFVQPAGAFLSFGLILGTITAIGNKNKEKKLAKGVVANG
jgi:electron transport complex protein RnfE